jgi:hypothetical protein
MVVFVALELGEAEGPVTVIYDNGRAVMELEGSGGYEASLSLGREHIDYLETVGEEGWEMVSHQVKTSNVVLQTVAYPQFKHFFMFKRRFPTDRELAPPVP